MLLAEAQLQHSPKRTFGVRHLLPKVARAADGAWGWIILHLVPPLDGEGLGWSEVSGKVGVVSTVTPTLPSPIKGEGSHFFSAGAT